MGLLTDRFGCRAVSASGALLALLGMLPFLWMARNHFSNFSPAVTLARLFAMGAGQGTINIPSMFAAYASARKEKLPIATTAINIAQRLAGRWQTTVMAVVMSLSASPLPAAGPGSFMAAFAFLVALQVLTLVSASCLPLRRSL